jgi:tRNA-splicing ligase RtcB
MGTLGGGNHIIEMDRDGGGDLWVIVHSGSRGLGGAVGTHHCKVAEDAGAGPLAGLPVDSERGQAFLGDLQWALDFARENRNRLLVETAEVLRELAGAQMDPSSRLDAPHNYVAQEEHGGAKLWIHRKGSGCAR